MKKEKGYAFIELMATIAIVSIMTAVVLNSLSSPRAKKSVETEARSLAAAIREAQSYALSGKQEGAISVCGWGIYYDSSADTHKYKLFYNKGANCGDASVGKDYAMTDSVDSTSYALENRVRFYNIENKAIYFKIPYGNIYENGASMVAINIGIEVVSEVDANEKYSVCVYSSGMVAEKAGSGGC